MEEYIELLKERVNLSQEAKKLQKRRGYYTPEGFLAEISRIRGKAEEVEKGIIVWAQKVDECIEELKEISGKVSDIDNQFNRAWEERGELFEEFKRFQKEYGKLMKEYSKFQKATNLSEKYRNLEEEIENLKQEIEFLQFFGKVKELEFEELQKKRKQQLLKLEEQEKKGKSEKSK